MFIIIYLLVINRLVFLRFLYLSSAIKIPKFWRNPRYSRERVMFWHPRAAAFDPSLKYAIFIAGLLEKRYGNIIPQNAKTIFSDFSDLWESEDDGQRDFVENLVEWVEMRVDIENLAL